MEAVDTNAISEWDKYLKEGNEYLRAALKGAADRIKFTPVILYNVTAMAIEKFMMALMMYSGKLPKNHTMQDLLEEVKTFVELPVTLERKMLFIDSFQEICSLDKIKIRPPDDTDILMILSTGKEVKSFVEERLPV